MQELLKLDTELFLWLNGFHTVWLDPIMVFITKTLVWIPLYLLLIYQIIKNYKKNSWIILVGLILVIVISDQLTSSFLKPYVGRLRPSHEPTLAGVIHLVDNQQGGLYGFASSHAANTFGVAMFVWLSLHKKHKHIWLVFGWSALMSYSRIYLGLHYPGDIVIGALIGLLSGWGLWILTEKVIDKRVLKLPTQ
jgi:undecaprenyl-diphosphatase